MRQSEFRVLMFMGQYVDMNLLEKGIYTGSMPSLFHKDTTIEMIIEQHKMMKDIMGNLFVTDKYFDNLKECELVTMELNKRSVKSD